MNSLYSLATKQSTSLQNELSALERDGSASWSATTSGQITASLAALDRTIDDYDSMARREIVEAKRDKALSRVARFRDDYSSLRKQFDRVKHNANNYSAVQNRNELLGATSSTALGGHAYGASSSSSLLNRSAAHANNNINESPFASSATSNNAAWQPNSPNMGNGYGDSSFGQSMHNNPRTNAALDESSFLSSTSQTLDSYIQQGQAVLGNLANQEDILKGTKRRLLSAANTLGLSRSTIQFIDRRTTSDFYILIGGALFTFLCFFLILYYLG